jgi:hypothetical protein
MRRMRYDLSPAAGDALPLECMRAVEILAPPWAAKLQRVALVVVSN